jgi:predicted Zn finger-like uncharacterized protein
MNVSCTSCSAKYAVPDEKVRGKKVKITCKHCGTGIIVDGTKLDAAGAAADSGPPKAAAAAARAPAPAPELQFDIAYPDDRQETLSVSQIVDKYAAGAMNEEAFLWREGMTDWKAPFDIPEVASALKARGVKKREPAPPPPPEDDETTRVQESPFEVPDVQAPAAGVWHEPGKEAPSSPEAAFNLTARSENPAATPSPTPAAATPAFAAATAKPAAAMAKPAAAAAARRSAARGGGDLFGDLAAAGSESDESLGTEAKEAPKLTGARNESSVLFSLDALVKQEKPAAKKPAKKQEDAAALLLGTDSGPSSIASVGTGSFGSAFAAPDFTAPVVAPPPEARAVAPVDFGSAPEPKKKGMGLWIGLGAVVVLAGGAFAAGLPAKLMGAAPAASSPTPAATPAPAPTPTPPAVTAEPSAAASSAPTGTSAGGGSAAPTAAVGGAAAKPAEPTKPSTGSEPAAPSEAAKASEKPTEAKPEEKPAEAKPAEKPAAPAGDAPPFDKAAAVAALTAAAGNAQSCKTPDGPTGSGKVSITFMPSGRATNTQVSGDLAGTAVGGCVARLFRSAKIPAFSGEAVTVSKSFAVQ